MHKSFNFSKNQIICIIFYFIYISKIILICLGTRQNDNIRNRGVSWISGLWSWLLKVFAMFPDSALSISRSLLGLLEAGRETEKGKERGEKIMMGIWGGREWFYCSYGGGRREREIDREGGDESKNWFFCHFYLCVVFGADFTILAAFEERLFGAVKFFYIFLSF